MRRVAWLARIPRGLIGAALAVRLIDEWWSYLPSGIVEDLRRDLDVSYSQAGWLVAALVAGGLVGAPLSALSDHFNRRIIATVGSGLEVLGLVTFAVAERYWLLVVASLVLGGASDLVIRPLESALAEEMGDDLDRALGRQHVFTFVGDIAGPALLALGAATSLGWRSAFWITAAFIALFTVFLATLTFPPPTAPAETVSGAFSEAITLVRRRDVRQLSVAAIVLLPLDEPILGFAVARLVTQSFRWQAQGLAIAYVFGGLAGSLLVGRRGLHDRTGWAGAWWLLGGTAIVAAGQWPPVGIVGFLLVGWGMALVWASLHHQELTVIPERSATVSSIVSVLAAFGAFTPALAGLVADRAGLSWSMVTFIGFALVLVVVMWGLRRVGPAV